MNMTLDPYSTFEDLCYMVNGRVCRAYTREQLPNDDTLLFEVLGPREVLEVIEGDEHLQDTGNVDLIGVSHICDFIDRLTTMRKVTTNAKTREKRRYWITKHAFNMKSCRTSVKLKSLE